MKHEIFSDDIYGIKIDFIYGTMEEFNNYLLKCYKEPPHEEATGWCLNLLKNDGSGAVVVFINEKMSGVRETILHEIIHAGVFVYRAIGAGVTDSDGEHFCHYCEWLYKICVDIKLGKLPFNKKSERKNKNAGNKRVHGKSKRSNRAHSQRVRKAEPQRIHGGTRRPAQERRTGQRGSMLCDESSHGFLSRRISMARV